MTETKKKRYAEKYENRKKKVFKKIKKKIFLLKKENDAGAT